MAGLFMGPARPFPHGARTILSSITGATTAPGATPTVAYDLHVVLLDTFLDRLNAYNFQPR
ncbi:MAG: hypothetical protein AB7O67_18575 [Vicinamibacterales bacterium]